MSLSSVSVGRLSGIHSSNILAMSARKFKPQFSASVTGLNLDAVSRKDFLAKLGK